MAESVKNYLDPWVRWRNKRFWILIILLIWILFGFFGIPYFVERTLVQTIGDTGRTLNVAKVQSNPFSLSLRVSGLEIRDPDATIITRFDEFYANFQLSSLFHRAWTFADLRLVGLHIEEERFDVGDTRWLRLISDLKPPQEQQLIEQEDKAPPRLIFHHLVIEEGSIGVTDHLVGGFQSEFGPVSVVINNLRTLPDHTGENEVSIVTPAGGVISWKGELQIIPLASSGHFTVRGKGLPAALRYADHLLPIGIEGEHLEVNFDYSLRVDDAGLNFEIDDLVTKTGQINVRMDGEDEPFVSLSEIHLDGGRLRWPQQTFNAKSLAINGVEAKVWLDSNGQLSLLDALPAQSTQNEGDASESSDESDWRIGLDRIEVRDSGILFEDRSITTPGTVEVSDLQLALGNVSNDENASMETELSLSLATGGSMSYTGTVTAIPSFSLQGRVTVNELALPLVQPWLAESVKVELSSGRLDLDTDISGSPPTSLLLTGSTNIDNLELRDTNRDQRLAGLESLGIDQFEFDLAAQSAKTSVVNLAGAFGRLHIFEDLSTNIGNLAVNPDSGDTPETDSPGMDLTIAGIAIENSSLDFADDSLPLPFRALIGDLHGDLSILSSSTAEPTRVDLEGQVNEFGQASISGVLTPMDFTQNTDIDMVFRNLEMSNLTPYTIQYAGYAIESGRLDMDLGYQFQQRKLEGENNIVIRQLELGDKIEHPDAASLPLKLAVALLKDSEGVIDVDLPVSGDLDDPTFKISGVIWKALGNLVTRIVTSPFRFLGNLVGVDSEDFGTLAFQPGESDVSPPDREQLLKLTEAMMERPELELAVTGVYAESLDVPALQAQAFENQLETTRAALLESGDIDMLGIERPTLETLFATAFPDIPLESIQAEFTVSGQEAGTEEEAVFDEPAYLGSLRTRLIESQNIGETELQTLATARAEAIVEVLQAAGSNADSVSISGTKASEAEEGAVLLELEVTVGDLGD